MALLTQKGIDEDAGWLASPTVFFDCEVGADVTLLKPHTIEPVGVSGCRAAATALAYIRKDVVPQDPSLNVPEVLRITLSDAPDKADRLRAALAGPHAMDPKRANSVATHLATVPNVDLRN